LTIWGDIWSDIWSSNTWGASSTPPPSGTGTFSPFQIAVQGLGPGWTTFNAATQGFGFDVEIIVVPPTQPSGGGGSGTMWAPDQPREIIIRVTYKGKVWEERRFVSALMLKSLEKVIASFKSIRTSVVNVAVKINNVLKRKIEINIFRK